MKRYLSVFEMITRSSIYKVLLILATMVVTEMAFFYHTMQVSNEISIEGYIEECPYSWIFRVAYLLITIVIVLPGMNIGSVQSYTLKRLSIKESRVFWLQALYNLLAYVLLWGTQLVVLMVSITIYLKNLPAGAVITNQTMFLAFYRNEFMHTILPLEDVPGWTILALIAITGALATATFSKIQRSGKFGFELLILAAATVLYIPRPLGYDISFIVVAIGMVNIIMVIRWISSRLEGNKS